MFAEMNYLGRAKTPFLFIIDFDAREPVVLPLDEAGNRGILFDIDGVRNYEPAGIGKKGVVLNKYPMSFERYRDVFDKVRRHFYEGDTYLLNLTFPTPVEINLTLEEIFYLSSARYKLYYPGRFVVFSPEIFVRIRGNVVSSYPMKGTIDAAVAGAADALLRNEKETAEHITIVDLIRNDLNCIARDIRVVRFRYLEYVHTCEKTLLQASSHIEGTMARGYAENIGDLLAEMLPAGSVTGAPKRKTVEIIKSLEGYDRGYYTGVFGYFDGSTLDSGVMIRFIESIDGKLYYKSGGGLTVYSSAREEYQELIDKVYVPIVGNHTDR